MAISADPRGGTEHVLRAIRSGRRLRQDWLGKPQARKRRRSAGQRWRWWSGWPPAFTRSKTARPAWCSTLARTRDVRPSGAGWHLPWPIETVTAVDLGHLNSADFQARMLTSDAMLVNVTASIQYQYADARAALFAARRPDAIMGELGEAVTRELIGARSIESLMGGADRAALTTALRAALQQPLDAMGLGVRVLAVNLTDVQVPQAVLGSQRELVQAGVERERIAREAQGYAAELVPGAQGLAQRQRLDAEAYKVQVVGEAEGDAARFDPIAAAYARAPEVTRTRLYIETVEAILARSKKIIIDGKAGGHTLVLPLDKLGDPGVLKAAGATGVVSAPAATAAPPAASPAPASSGGTPSGGDSPARDDRSREREQRQ